MDLVVIGQSLQRRAPAGLVGSIPHYEGRALRVPCDLCVGDDWGRNFIIKCLRYMPKLPR